MKKPLGGLVVLLLLAWLSSVRAPAPGHIVWRNLSPAVWLWSGVPLEATYTPTMIKSIQRGTVTITAGNTGATVAVTSVNTGLASVRYLGASISNGDSASSLGGVFLSSNVQISAFRLGTTGNLVMKWELVEFLPSAVSRVQRGFNNTVTVTSLAVPITAVNMARSALLHLGNATNDTASGQFANEITSVELTSAAVITITVGSALFTQTTSWEVVEFK